MQKKKIIDESSRNTKTLSLAGFAKEPYKRDFILQKRPIILRSLLIVATPYDHYLKIYQRQIYQKSEVDQEK